MHMGYANFAGNPLQALLAGGLARESQDEDEQVSMEGIFVAALASGVSPGR